ncbi:hypothetical protein [Salinispira pacifica]
MDPISRRNRGRRHILQLVTAAAALLPPLLFGSCASSDQNTAILWTNQPEFAAYAETFNAQQDRYRVLLVYKANPAVDIATTSERPDLVVGEYLRSQRVRRSFSSLNGLIGAQKIDPASFYAEALKTGRWGGDQLLLPVSFDLPAVMFRKGAVPAGDDSFFVSLPELKKLAKPFNKEENGSYVQLGFSPHWSGDFLYSFARLSGADFREDANGKPVWNAAALNGALEAVHTWIDESNGGSEADTAFKDRYVYEPPEVLLAQHRIEFAYVDATSYFQTAESKRQDLDFRWIAADGRVPVLENMVFAGIPSRARHRRAAEAFLTWFFQRKTQAKLLEENRLKQITTFGISDGFSALSTVNELDMPHQYPQLIGHLPTDFNLLFPPALPRNWRQIKDEVVKPWLVAAAGTKEPSASLEEQIKSWLLQQGD